LSVLVPSAAIIHTGLLKMIVRLLTTCHSMDQKILKVFFYGVRCAVVMNFSTWSTVY